MNKTLAALSTKLSWQLKDVNETLETLIKELGDIQSQLFLIEDQIHKACSIPTTIRPLRNLPLSSKISIHPEQEISRLNFIVRSQEEQDKLRLAKKVLELRQAQFKTRQIRINTELNLLEKYQLKQQKAEQQNILACEQQERDEWALQERNPHEN